MDDFYGSSSLWDVLPTITGQYFNSLAAAPPPPAAAPPAILPPAVTSGLQQFLPLIILAAIGLLAFRVLK